ncbi:MAG: hypothetical protein WCF85_10935 [Rhodospirillaceae bacterium]
MHDESLDTPAAAKYIGKSTSWMKQARCSGDPGAPQFIKIGRSVRYRKKYLDAYLAGRTVTSTAAAKALGPKNDQK